MFTHEEKRTVSVVTGLRGIAFGNKQLPVNAWAMLNWDVGVPPSGQVVCLCIELSGVFNEKSCN